MMTTISVAIGGACALLGMFLATLWQERRDRRKKP